MTADTAILRCPITGGDLEFAGADAVAQVRAAISVTSLTHLNGSPALAEFNGFLQTNDRQIRYPVRDNILVLLPDFALVGTEARRAYASHLTSSTTLAIMRFYDEIGWQITDRRVFYDADINEDMRDVSRRYIRDCHLRVNKYLQQRGRYLLDIASGPVQYEDYLTYSHHFERRICCDISFKALKWAAARIGDKGIFIQCDITNIPLKDQAVDAFVSLHTIYHVPPQKQMTAFRELERVTRNGGRGVVVYSWGSSAWGARLSGPTRALRAAPGRVRTGLRPFVPNVLLTWLRRCRPITAAAAGAHGTPSQAASTYCFHAHNFKWYRSNVAAGGHWTLRVWRTLSLDFLKRNIPDRAAGRRFLGFVYRIENRFPALLGRIGQYPLFVFRKSDPAA